MPNETKIRVPPTGVRRSGVKKAMPASPYFFQTATIFLLLLEKIGFLVLNLIPVHSFSFAPTRVNRTTLVIMDAVVSRSIFQNGYPAAEPKTGPAINLNIERRNIPKSLISSSFIVRKEDRIHNKSIK